MLNFNPEIPKISTQEYQICKSVGTPTGHETVLTQFLGLQRGARTRLEPLNLLCDSWFTEHTTPHRSYSITQRNSQF